MGDRKRRIYQVGAAYAALLCLMAMTGVLMSNLSGVVKLVWLLLLILLLGIGSVFYWHRRSRQVRDSA